MIQARRLLDREADGTSKGDEEMVTTADIVQGIRRGGEVTSKKDKGPLTRTDIVLDVLFGISMLAAAGAGIRMVMVAKDHYESGSGGQDPDVVGLLLATKVTATPKMLIEVYRDGSFYKKALAFGVVASDAVWATAFVYAVL